MRLALAFLLLVLAPLAAPAGEAPEGLEDRPSVGIPVRFIDTRGFVFRPERLILASPAGTFAAAIPPTTDEAYSEDRLDLTGLPLVGPFFRERLAPGDARREGIPVGDLFRVGTSLLLETAATPHTLEGRRLVLTAALPRAGIVSFHLPPPAFHAAALPQGARVPAGRAYLIGENTLVLAGPGDAVLIDDWDAFFRGR